MNWKDLDIRTLLGFVILLVIVLFSFANYRALLKNGNVEARMMFGFTILNFLAIIALILALGHVEQNTSYGLSDIIICLSTLAGGFAQWAFSKPKEPEKPT